MSHITRTIIQHTGQLQASQQSDRLFFINRAMECCDRNDTYGAMQDLKRLKLMEDADIIYRLTKKDIDWNDMSLATTTQS
jgi:hypothetical protein